jgi:hypothetical protein
MSIPSKYLWPMAAVVAGGAAAWFVKPQSETSTSAYSAAAAAAPAPDHPTAKVHGAEGQAAAAQDDSGERLQGKVLEAIAVPNYTYLRLAPTSPNAGSEVWAAVPTTEVKVGQSVTIVGAQRMEKFASATLKRTFESIYFGALEDPSGKTASNLPPGHPEIGTGAAASPTLPPGHPDIAASAAAPRSEGSSALAPTGIDPMTGGPHGSPTSGGNDVPIGKVEKASGPLGYTVADAVNQRSKLAGKKIHVRGVVVKSTSGVLGKTFLHLRDGSGSAAAGDHDLAVTTEQSPTVGSTVQLEGTVVVDKDFGSGYSYRILLEDAKTVE